MSDTRLAQARDEAARRYPQWSGLDLTYTAHQVGKHITSAFVSGAMWADAHPYSTPEDLVAAYEDGQRDAVSKGLAKMRITREQFLDALDAHVGLGASGEWVTVEDMLIAAFMRVGIEVEQ